MTPAPASAAEEMVLVVVDGDFGRLDRLMGALGEKPMMPGDDMFKRSEPDALTIRLEDIERDIKLIASPPLESITRKQTHPVSLRDSRRKVRRK